MLSALYRIIKFPSSLDMTYDIRWKSLITSCLDFLFSSMSNLRRSRVKGADRGWKVRRGQRRVWKNQNSMFSASCLLTKITSELLWFRRKHELLLPEPRNGWIYCSLKPSKGWWLFLRRSSVWGWGLHRKQENMVF